MPVPKIPPGWGGKVPHVHFCYTGTPCSTKWKAWIAGPTVWIVGHNKRPAKPCVDVMTAGALLCRRCAKGEAPRKFGYVPLYRMTDAKPVVVLVYEEEEPHLASLVTHQGVTVGREAEKSDSVFVRPLMGDYAKYTSTLYERMRPADCTESLLSMWGLPEWSMWCRGSDVPLKRDPLKEVEAPTRSNGEGYSDIMRNAARRWAVEDAADASSGDDAVKAAIDRAELKAKQSAHTNGKHKPKG